MDLSLESYRIAYLVAASKTGGALPTMLVIHMCLVIDLASNMGGLVINVAKSLSGHTGSAYLVAGLHDSVLAHQQNQDGKTQQHDLCRNGNNQGGGGGRQVGAGGGGTERAGRHVQSQDGKTQEHDLCRNKMAGNTPGG